MPEKQVLTTLVGTAAPLLTVAVSDTDELESNSPFLPRAWLRSTPFLLDDQIISPSNLARLNADINFDLPKLATILYDVALSFAAPPVLTTGPSLEPSFYVDQLGFALIVYFRIIFGSNQIFDVQPYDLYMKYRFNLTRERLEAINELIYGDSTTAERTALLANGTGANPMIIPLWLPLSDDPTQSMPIVTLSQRTRFTLQTDTLRNITQSSVLNALTPTGDFNFNLLITVAYTTGDESNYFLSMAEQNQGLAYMIHQAVRQNTDDAFSQASGYEFVTKLSSLTKPLSILYFGFVPAKLLDNTGRNDRFFFKPNPPPPVPRGMSPYNPILGYKIDSNGLDIQRYVQRNLYRLYKRQSYFPSPSGDEIFFQPYTLNTMAVNASLGYLDYSNLNNPTIRVTFGVGGTGVDPDDPLLPQKLRLIVIAFDYNFLFFKSGNLSRAFN
jgi:hypothetical protein